MLPSRRLVALSITFVVLAAGCRKKPEVQTAPAPAPAPQQPASSPSSSPPPASSPAPANTGPSDAALAEARATIDGAIYFLYDQDGLTDEARAQLDAKLAVLMANTGVQIRVTGHADERGSDEYNLALGQRRAASIRRYFADRGVADSRVAIVSVGEEQPECNSGEEGCWQRNRRATFQVTSGTITAPGRR